MDARERAEWERLLRMLCAATFVSTLAARSEFVRCIGQPKNAAPLEQQGA